MRGGAAFGAYPIQLYTHFCQTDMAGGLHIPG